MNCVAAEPPGLTPSGGWCIVGYGNPERRDDGLGPHIVRALTAALPPGGRWNLVIAWHLEPELVETVSEADGLILVDATSERLTSGRRWSRLVPRLDEASPLSHSVRPGFLLGLVELLHGRRPPAWQVSVQGEEFHHGRGLSTAAARRARRAVTDIKNFLVGAAGTEEAS